MLYQFNCYVPQGYLHASNTSCKTTAVKVVRDFYILLDEDNNIAEYTYKGESSLEREIFWKCVKARSESFESILICPFKKEERLPYTSLINLLEYIGFDKAQWNATRRLTYRELFMLPDNLKMQFFNNVNVAEMIENLGYERIETKGVEVERRNYNLDGSYTVEKKTNIYELLKVKTSDLMEGRLEQDVYNYAVRCWCASINNNVHYLWIEDEYATDPLTGIASTCRIQKDLLPHIIYMKRQGDLFLPEFKEGFDPSIIDPSAEKVTLSSKQYFDLLVAET